MKPVLPSYVPILPAKKAEFVACNNLSSSVHDRCFPVFDIPRFTDKIASLKRYQGKSNPIECYLNDIASSIVDCRKGLSLALDISKWSPDSTLENGEHVLPFCVTSIASQGGRVVPVIGYDRWEDSEYVSALEGINGFNGEYCIRLEQMAFEDIAEGDYFRETFDDIVDTLGLDTSKCSVILDFGDVTMTSIAEILALVESAYDALSGYAFKFISLAGSSIAKSVDVMVPKHNSTGYVVRRELNAWKALKHQNRYRELVLGDYCVVNPRVADGIIATHANGKIRYTINEKYFIVRGYSRATGEKGGQMHGLCKKLMSSGHYMGESFSWGDSRISDCSMGLMKGTPANWVSIDTSHHVSTVVSEVHEFETSIKAKTPVFNS